jgi:spore coat polysaccharide biosynthesis predicted glycosyltransferase SpsG
VSVATDRPDRDRVVRLIAGGSGAQGRGHATRALALAEALRVMDLPVELAYMFGEPSDREASRAAELDVAVVAPYTDGDRAPSVSVVDLPDPNDALPAVHGSRLVVLDDRNLFRGNASIVVQPSRHAWVGPGTAERVLAGYEYIPISSEYRRLAKRSGPSAEPRDTAQVFVCFGGSDPGDVTRRVSGVLADGPWRLDVVVGPSYAGPLDELSAEVRRDPPDLASRLAESDLAVLGAGTMKFEAACLGLPMILAAAADDQLPVGKEFGATGAACWLGDGRKVDPMLVRATVEELLADRAALAAMGDRARSLVDGGGAQRIAEAIVHLLDENVAR